MALRARASRVKPAEDRAVPTVPTGAAFVASEARLPRASGSRETLPREAMSRETQPHETQPHENHSGLALPCETQHPSLVSRSGYIAAGHVCVALGVIGIFVPLMPTTVFLLLAAAAYARGSTRFYRWLLWHPRLGPYIRDFRERGGMPLRAKLLAVAMITVVLGSSIVLVVSSAPIQVALAAFGVGLIVYLLRLPTV